MPDADQAVSEAAVRLAEKVPSSVVTGIAEALSACRPAPSPVDTQRIAAQIPHLGHRELASRFLSVWQLRSAEVQPTAAAAALLAAGRAIERHRARHSAELVWTGPDVGVIPVRHTEQALLQLIDAAETRVTIVSFAVYRIPRVCQAVVRAADRGCSVRIILETPDGQEGEAGYDTIAALGPVVGECAQVYTWPLAARPVDPKGHRALMHAKAATSDGTRLLLSSANLTEYAFTTNMELGILLTGGPLPADAERHFDALIEAGVLVRSVPA